MTDDDLKRSGRSDVNPKIHTDKKDAEEKKKEKGKRRPHNISGVNPDMGFNSADANKDKNGNVFKDAEKQKILEEVEDEFEKWWFKQKCLHDGYKKPCLCSAKYIQMKEKIAFAKGEEFERKSFEDKIMYTTEDGWDWTVKRGKKAIQNMERNVARADKRVKELETELKQSEQRGYEKGCKDTEKRMINCVYNRSDLQKEMGLDKIEAEIEEREKELYEASGGSSKIIYYARRLCESVERKTRKLTWISRLPCEMNAKRVSRLLTEIERTKEQTRRDVLGEVLEKYDSLNDENDPSWETTFKEWLIKLLGTSETTPPAKGE